MEDVTALSIDAKTADEETDEPTVDFRAAVVGIAFLVLASAVMRRVLREGEG